MSEKNKKVLIIGGAGFIGISVAKVSREKPINHDSR